MTLHSIYDNGGATLDRYTINIIDDESGMVAMFGSSENPAHPLGFGQYCGDYLYTPEDEDEINFYELPKPVQKYVDNLLT